MRIDSAPDGLEVVISRRNALALVHKASWGAEPPRLERPGAGAGLSLALTAAGAGPEAPGLAAAVEPGGWLELTVRPEAVERAVAATAASIAPVAAGATALAGGTPVRLLVERDERHYAGRGLPPGPMHPATERFIAAA